MQVGDDGRDGEAPFEAEGQIDNDADDDQQQRQRAILGEFPADLRADEFDALDLRAIAERLQAVARLFR